MEAYSGGGQLTILLLLPDDATVLANDYADQIRVGVNQTVAT
jgi:hypothetical protein